MLRFSSAQFDGFEQARLEAWADLCRPGLVAEFGAARVAALEPLSRVGAAAAQVKLDEAEESYRFARVACGLAALAPDDPRHMLVQRIAGTYQSREDRLVRMERAALGEAAEGWRDHWPGSRGAA